jgi:hypothetical protein
MSKRARYVREPGMSKRARYVKESQVYQREPGIVPLRRKLKRNVAKPVLEEELAESLHLHSQAHGHRIECGHEH